MNSADHAWRHEPSLFTIHGPTLRHESLEKEDDKHDVSLKPLAGTLRVEDPSGRAWPAAGSESCVVVG